MEMLRIDEIVKAVDGVLLYGDEHCPIHSVSTNSKEVESGALFVPIIGERVDGHNYIDSALENGAAAVFTSREGTIFIKGKAYIQVKDTLEALQALASYYRDKFDLPIIGVTGSVGKTTTKEMISTVLEQKYKVLKTSGNMNSQVGVPLMMFQIQKEHEIAVIEMGMSEFGEMEKLASIVKPDVGVMTNIGVSHIAQLKTQENIRSEKLNMIKEFKEDAILYVNGDDVLLADIPKHRASLGHPILENISVCTYGINNHCDYQGSQVRTIGNETHFLYGAAQDNREITLGVLGIHNVYNALVALAIGERYQVTYEMANKALGDYRPIAMRGQIQEIDGMLLIDDTYNASPDSMKSSIAMLLDLPNRKRRIAVLADVRELGELSYECHYGVGEYIAGKNVDLVVTIGMEAKAIAQAINNNDKEMLTISVDTNQEAILYLREFLKSGDGVIIKGSRGMHTEEVLEGINKKLM